MFVMTKVLYFLIIRHFTAIKRTTLLLVCDQFLLQILIGLILSKAMEIKLKVG